MSSTSLFDSDRLEHILKELVFLEKYSKGISLDDLVQNETLSRAFERSFEIIGEATKNVSQVTRSKYPHIDWRAMAGMRDKLIHQYFDVNYRILLTAVTDKIPPLRKEIQEILDKESKGNN